MITMTEGSIYEVLSKPEVVKIPQGNKTTIRIRFYQKNIDTQEVTQGDYTPKHYLLLNKQIGETVVVNRKKGHSGLWYTTTK